MIGPDDPLVSCPRRVLVAGVSGVGKTTLAGRVSRILNIPHTEIDSLFHGENWIPRDAFMSDVDAFTRSDAWVTEWQYSVARPLLAERADILIWLDLPFLSVTLPRVIRRTIRRRVRRETLWNGNTEAPLLTFFSDPEHIVRWAWSTRHKYRESVPRLEADHEGLVVVRLRSQREVERWITDRLAPLSSSGGV